MGRKVSVLLVFLWLLAALMLFGCGAGKKHPADVVAPIITTTNKGWDIGNKALLSLHDVCKNAGNECPAELKPIVDRWNEVDDLADKIDEKLSQLEEAWRALGKLDSPENKTEFENQLKALDDLYDELQKLVPGLKISRFIPQNLTRSEKSGGR